MIRLTTLGIVFGLAFSQTLAPAGLVKINIEDKTIFPAAAGGRLTLDVTFEEPGVNQIEDLIGYDLGFTLEKVGGGTGGLRFVPPYAEKPQPFVFPGAADFHAFVPAPFPDVLLNVWSRSGTVEITRDPVNAARLVLEYDPGTAPGEYRVRLDPNFTVLAPGPNGPEPEVLRDVSDVGVIRIVPEPASLPLLALCALFTLRRRRRG